MNILWFDKINKKDISKVGGKGANLGEMFNNKIPIPEGFCVTAQAYEKFIECLARTPTRDVLKKLPKKDRQQCKEFQDLRELGEKFSLHLADWLARKYSADHPIHHALIF